MKIENRINIVFTELNFETVANENTKLEEYIAPTRFMILPASPIVGRNGREYTFDGDEILSNFENEKLKIPIDINHATEIKAPKGEEAPAVAWVGSLEKHIDGSIWANNTEWNNSFPLKYKEYKYISPALNSDFEGKIKRITSIGLVNKPNFDLPALNCENNNKQGEKIMELDKDILKTLNLPEGSGKDAVIQTIHNLKNNQSEQVKLVEQINTLNMELASVKNDVLNEKKNQAVESALKNGKIAPSTKDFYMNTLNSEDSIQAFIETMEKAPSILTSSIDNKSNNFEVNSLNFEDKEHCKKYDLSAEDFKKKKEELFG